MSDISDVVKEAKAKALRFVAQGINKPVDEFEVLSLSPDNKVAIVRMKQRMDQAAVFELLGQALSMKGYVPMIGPDYLQADDGKVEYMVKVAPSAEYTDITVACDTAPLRTTRRSFGMPRL